MTYLIIIKGRVQGVSFRKFVKKTADKYILNGYVRNEDDGSVTIVINSHLKDNISSFISEVKKGNILSRIDSFNAIEVETDKEYKEFVIESNKNTIIDQYKAIKNLMKDIKKGNIPSDKTIKHVAIIADGNRRWAKARGLPSMMGHKVGSNEKRFEDMFEVCNKYKIKYLTVWAFSTENWKRPKEEVDYLMKLLAQKIAEFKDQLMKYQIRILMLGNKKGLDPHLVKGISELEELTKDNKGIVFQVAFNYGGRDEILTAVNKALESKKNNINQEEFEKLINVNNIPDPDIIIRTGGDQRLSGFLTYSSVYSELFFLKTLFPDFDTRVFEEVIKEYYTRQRRYGA